jgi:hypothetical protein
MMRGKPWMLVGVAAVAPLVLTASAQADPSTHLKTTLFGLTMPPGSFALSNEWCSDCNYPHEEWQSGTDLNDTIRTIRAQLPIGAPFNGVPWCTEDDSAPTMPAWIWAGGPHTSEIDIGVVDYGNGDERVTIEIPSPDRVNGCIQQ